ncbi:hypothetical protein [Dietzia kunjamensis]|uniref:hypothetical protein n=1 Tax=Dietzia kunjamensis TaxID=322509 RepID=UPI0020984175|nr:hypothetical protein [Dietzia kunjamensis]USX47740.1 hypothetical protein NHB83_17635 [Dietzia kunjamensis]
MSTATVSDVLVEFEVGTSRGRRFEPTVERELDPALRSLAEGLPSAKDGLLGVVEFPAPRGVPDLLVMTKGYADLRRRLSSNIPLISGPSDCAVVASLDINRTRSASSVSRTTGMSVSQVKRRLRMLAQLGIVLPHGAGYRRAPTVVPSGRMYAFEAKVSNWRAGLKQAVRYSAWADATALVLLRPPSNLSDVIDNCTSLGVGLAVRDTWVRRPKLVPPQAALRLQASEQLAIEVSRAGISL